jgi:hypothetical protein
MLIEVDHVRLLGLNQHGRVCSGDDPKILLVHKFHQHFENAALIGSG